MNREKTRSSAALKAKVEKKLGWNIPNEAWAFLRSERYDSDALQERDPAEFLLKTVKKLAPVWGLASVAPSDKDGSIRRQRRTKGTEQRFQALSEFLASVARDCNEVMAFRHDVLQNRLLSLGEVGSWIDAQPLERAIMVGLPPGYSYQPDVAIARKMLSGLDWAEDISTDKLDPPLSTLSDENILGDAPTPFLKYPAPGQKSFQKAPAGHSGIRRKLYDLARQLSRIFGWHQGQATAFVLTDTTPSITADMVAVGMPSSFALGDDGFDDFYEDNVVQPRWSLVRLNFSIDPMLTPREVQHIYSKYRAKLLPRKQRTQSEKHLYLAAIKDPSRRALTDWNSRFPKWKYLKHSQFGTAVRTARRRLLTPSGWSVEAFRVEDVLDGS